MNDDNFEREDWKSLLLDISLYLISFASAVTTGFKLYVNEFSQATDNNDVADSNGSYEGAKIESSDAKADEAVTMA